MKILSVESPVLARLKRNRKRRQLEEDEARKSKGASKRLKLDKIAVAEDAAAHDEAIDDKSTEENSEKESLTVKSETQSRSPSSDRKLPDEDLDATHFSELIGEETNKTDEETTSQGSKWAKCRDCSKRLLKIDLQSHTGQLCNLYRSDWSLRNQFLFS